MELHRQNWLFFGYSEYDMLLCCFFGIFRNQQQILLRARNFWQPYLQFWKLRNFSFHRKKELIILDLIWPFSRTFSSLRLSGRHLECFFKQFSFFEKNQAMIPNFWYWIFYAIFTQDSAYSILFFENSL